MRASIVGAGLIACAQFPVAACPGAVPPAVPDPPPVPASAPARQGDLRPPARCEPQVCCPPPWDPMPAWVICLP